VIEYPVIDWWAVSPDIAMGVGAAVTLLIAAFLRGRGRGIGFVVGLATAGLVAGMAIAQWGDAPVSTIADTMVVDQVTQISRIAVSACLALTLIAAFGWSRLRDSGAEFAALLMFAAAGMNLVAAASSFMTLFVALELFSISLYALSGFARDRWSLEAGFKYLVLGTIGSVILVYGAAFLYGATGSFQFAEVAAGLEGSGTGDLLVVAGGVLVLVGLAFKVGAVPFHMWVPDVYEGAPTPVTGFMAAGTKIVAFIMMARVLYEALPALRDTWEPALVAMAVATMVLAAIAALVQTNVKRMLAYALVGSSGYALIAVIVGGEQGLRALLLYLVATAPLALGAFAVIALHERDTDGPATLDSLRAWGFDRPLAGLALTVFLLGFAGFPLTSGFIGKFLVFGSAVQSDQWTWLAVVGAISSVIGLGYLLRVIGALYDRGAKSGVLLPAAPGFGSLNLVIVVCLVVVIALGVAPGLGIDWAGEAARSLAAGR